MGTSLWIFILRHYDLLALDIELINFLLVHDDIHGSVLRRDAVNEPSYLIAHIPPQHIHEEVLAGAPGNVPLPSRPLRRRLSGPSRLVFRIPESIDQIPYSVDALLDWSQLEPVLAPVARASALLGHPSIEAPGRTTTSIEAPFRLMLSPGEDASWIPSSQRNFLNSGPFPIWTLTLQPDNQSGRAVRPIWDRTNGNEALPFTGTLDAADRHEFVRLGSDFGIQDYSPEPAACRELRLSALGAWLDIDATWDPPDSLTREGWLHRATMGRDQSVVVLARGNLYPFGHRASLITVSKRELADRTTLPGSSGVLFQQLFVVVQEPTRDFSNLPERERRHLPFREVRITTRTSPPISEEHEPNAFWPFTPQGSVVSFDLIGIDHDGVERPFSTPLLFVEHGFDNEAVIRHRYDNPPDRRKIPFFGQPVAFVPSSASGGDGLLASDVLEFAASLTGDSANPFLPHLREAKVRIPALEALAGTQKGSLIQYSTVYLNLGFSASNKNQVFATLKQGDASMRMRSDQAGGLGAPNLALDCLSRSQGPIAALNGDIEGLAEGIFLGPDGPDPGRYLKSVLGDSRLFGILSLADLVSVAGNDPLKQVPKAKRFAQNGHLVTEFAWQSALQENGQATLDLLVRSTMPRPQPGVATEAPKTTVDGTLTNFTLSLIKDVAEAIDLTFERVTFGSGTGQKSHFDARVKPDGVTFKGPLEFLTQLKHVLGEGLAAPPGINVGPGGVKVRYSLGIPNVSVGMFTLQNVAINAGLELPFSDPTAELPVRLRFAFCERHRPFLLTVSGLGGGGFVGLELTPEGIALLEASLEFGASVALNLGIASGAASIMAGIYFRMELQGPAADQGVQLTGYLRCNGSLEVLSLIRISAEFYLGFTWKVETKKVWGLARLTVEVELAFFSKSVSLEVERQFSGTSADPLFSEMMNESEWTEYVQAFAA